MTRFADTKTINKQQEALGEMHPDIIGFKEEIAKKFPNIRYTSGLRPNAKTKQGKTSRHSLGQAYDVAPDPELLNYLTTTKEGVSLLNKYNLGILDETSAEMMAKTGATGAHYHIGADTQLVAQTKARFNKFGEVEVPKRETVSPLPEAFTFNQGIAPNVETEKEDDTVDVAKQSLEVKMGLKEELLTAIQDAQIQPLERELEQQVTHTQPFTSPYEGLVPNMQSGGEYESAMTGMMKPKIGWGNAFENPAIQRMSQPYPKTGMTPEGIGTHYMASFDNYAVPLLQDKGGMNLEYNEKPTPSNENIRFNNSQEADYFAEHYKEVAPMTAIFNNFQSGGIIENDMGQWLNPGSITKINSNNITMEGVNYDVLGISDTGDVKLMKPNQNYIFEGKSVTEYPLIKKLKLKKK